MITVFTPTYNRAYIIDKLYKSLLNQSVKDFEWIVIDDGSTDNTEEYFNSICKNGNPFEIVYIKQKNGGKHRAINKAVQIAKGELFFIVDSDDYLMPNAIEKLTEWYKGLDSSKTWAGVSGARGYNPETPIGGIGGKRRYVDAKNTEREKYNLLGDKAEAYFTDVLKKFPFPEFDGENFITEEVVWNAIAYDGYYVRWYKDIIYICNYLEDGLTKSGNSKNQNNPQGVLYWAKQQLKIFNKNFKKKLRAINAYYEVAIKTKKIKEIAKELSVSVFSVRFANFAAKIIRKIK